MFEDCFNGEYELLFFGRGSHWLLSQNQKKRSNELEKIE